MRPDVVTFDCAQTLVKVDWQPAAIAVESAMRAGLTLDRQVAGELYARRLQTMWPEFMHLNLRRDADVLAEFWLRLTQEWMQQAGLPVEKASEVVGHANEILFGDGSKVFVLYEDTVPCLERLKRAGYRLAVVSNWD
ncbi:MAG TPA: hypothetical protein VNI20_09970, partial [Fimbriimonadaceae bacterium]|nr:hypothetical protein [Fimbriimonadaceae bacterium]